MYRHYKTHIFTALTVGLLLLINGCGTKETIDPFAMPEPIDSQLAKKPLQVSIPIDSMEVPSFGTEFEEVEELGPLFRELAGVFANVALDQEGGQDYQIDPVVYFAPELDQVEDWTMLNYLDIKHVKLKIVDAIDFELASFGFIKELRIYLDFTLPEEGQMDRRGRGLLLASYSKEKDRKNLKRLGRELHLNIHNLNWKEILKTQRTFVIYTELVVESVPETEMKFGGDLGVSVGLKIGY
ncbi:MAG: hypothetical protein NXH75_03315 [Halobacteriovoraceae bacterium]|nr:hypothetical protein [Halobacteriovoraceae bacterium]